MRVGYARVSTTEQSIDAQLERLADCGKVFHEKLSGKRTIGQNSASAGVRASRRRVGGYSS